MAEVLSPSLQPSASIAMLHSRPSSADAFQAPQQYPQTPRLSHSSRGASSIQNGTVYRASASAPVQPYAFQATPNLRQDPRSTSASTPSHGVIGGQRHAHTQSASDSSDTSSVPSAKDDSVMGSRNGSLINLSSAVPDLSLTNFDTAAKPSPDRYRRPAQKRVGVENVAPKPTSPRIAASAPPPGSGMASVSHLLPQQPSLQREDGADDMTASKSSLAESAKRYRRRSLNPLDTQNLQVAGGAQRPVSGHGATSTPTTLRPISHHERSGSDDSQASSRKAAQRGAEMPTMKSDQKAPVVPPRGSSDATKRLNNPSPLSKQAVGDPDERPATAAAAPARPMTYAAAARGGAHNPSPAAQHLAALSDKDAKGMKSRLRRAFSFGSAQELKRAAAENSSAAQQARQTQEQHQQSIDEELDAEQQEIARRQEAAGIGAGIYSGQGGFTGSTDNLSISSTASSASMMLRKMGRGAKKGARSIKGLFRPKSVIGVPAADGPIQAQSTPALIEPSMAQVSMVTVEAERLKVNIDANPSDKPHGITGFPKLERNSIDAAGLGIPPPSRGSTRGSADGSDSNSRRSIVGSDKDRAEVLAAVKKGILKRSGTASPAGSPVIRAADFLPPADSPTSTVLSTPKETRSSSVNVGVSGDYFSARMMSQTRSMPNTPSGTARNISFSPRIQFHDAWSSTEYDRRGEVATCNRLTPMLAQQIKEELNTFKMEMEVHELSKPHTHFF